MSFWSIARKDLKTLTRDRSALIFTFGLPLIFTFIFGIAFGSKGSGDASPPLKLLIVNQDTGPQSAALIEAMQKIGLSVDTDPGGERSLTEKVKNGDYAVGVIVPPDYSKRLPEIINEIRAGGKPSPINLRVLTDPAQPQITSMARGAVLGAIQKATAPLYRPGNTPSGEAETEIAPAVNLEVSSPQAAAKPSPGDLIMPGFIVYFVFFMANSVASTLLNERSEGTLRRMLSAPVSRGQILVGKLMARGIMGLLQTGILFFIGFTWLHLSVGSSPFGLVLVALSTVFAACGLGLLIATFGKTMEQIQGMTTLVLLLMGFLSGTFIPRQLLPPTLQKASLITPHAWALNAYQDLILRHLPLTHTLVNIGVVLLFGAVFFGLALTRFQFE